MAELYVYNDVTHLTTVRDGTVELTQAAEAGAVGTGRLAIDDTDGTLSLIGQKNFAVNQSSNGSNTRLYRGFVADRQYGRDAGEERAPHVSKGRGIGLALEDLNSILGFRRLRQRTTLTAAQAGNRPSETVNARMSWLLGSYFISGLVADRGRVASSTVTMTKSDYRNQFPGDVLADMALAAGNWNYHVQDYGSGPELIFRDDNSSTADSSPLRISTLASEVDSTQDSLGATKTFAPLVDAVLARRPERVISDIGYSYAKGTVNRERAATATAFNGERSGTATNSNVKTSAVAEDQADAELFRLSTEEDIITCSIQVPASAIDLIPAGWRVQAKFEHLTTEGYGSAFTWFRVIERTFKPMNAEAAFYEIDLKLSPQEAAVPAPACSENATASGTRYPLGGSGSTPNPSDGVVYYFRPGFPDPTVFTTPQVGYAGQWHFPRYGAGGLGTFDYAGDCVQNALIFMTIGNGTWTIQTNIYGGTVRALRVNKGAPGAVTTLVSNINSGDSVVVTISDTTADDCVRFVRIFDVSWPVCGSAWGWSSAAWVAA